ncbi:MAG TPA: oligosaccharide repeat unit polymerase, partial [Flavobacteriaceae bacterium]|nr:oligosaccharide repeat unit polymerase [Flavobacteriaceae bacterium]
MLVSVLFTTIILFYGNFQFRAIFTWFPSLMIIFIATLFLIKSGKVDKIFLKVVVINSLWLVYALAFSFSVLNFNIHIKAILETFLYILIFSIIINYFIKDVKKLFKTILFSLNIFLMVSSFVFIFKITGLYDDGHPFSSLYSNRNTYAFMAVVYLIIILNLPSYISYKFKTISILMLLFFILITGSSKGSLGIIIVLVLYFLGKYSLKKIIFILPLFFILIFGSSFIFETTVIRLNKKIDAISKFENNYRAD